MEGGIVALTPPPLCDNPDYNRVLLRNGIVHEQLRRGGPEAVGGRPQLAEEERDCSRDSFRGHLVRQRWTTVQALPVEGHDMSSGNQLGFFRQCVRRCQ